MGDGVHEKMVRLKRSLLIQSFNKYLLNAYYLILKIELSGSLCFIGDSEVSEQIYNKILGMKSAGKKHKARKGDNGLRVTT